MTIKELGLVLETMSKRFNDDAVELDHFLHGNNKTAALTLRSMSTAFYEGSQKCFELAVTSELKQ